MRVATWRSSVLPMSWRKASSTWTYKFQSINCIHLRSASRSICLLFINQFACHSYLSIYLSIYVSFIYLSINISVYLSFCKPIYLSMLTRDLNIFLTIAPEFVQVLLTVSLKHFTINQIPRLPPLKLALYFAGWIPQG